MSLNLLTILSKRSVLDVWLSSELFSALLQDSCLILIWVGTPVGFPFITEKRQKL